MQLPLSALCPSLGTLRCAALWPSFVNVCAHTHTHCEHTQLTPGHLPSTPFMPSLCCGMFVARNSSASARVVPLFLDYRFCYCCCSYYRQCIAFPPACQPTFLPPSQPSSPSPSPSSILLKPFSIARGQGQHLQPTRIHTHSSAHTQTQTYAHTHTHREISC